VNQALGQVIRHISDYGAVYLVDNRYCINKYDERDPINNKFTLRISEWIKPYIMMYKSELQYNSQIIKLFRLFFHSLKSEPELLKKISKNL
jgi:Rad3-related DNA helicase